MSPYKSNKTHHLQIGRGEDFPEDVKLKQSGLVTEIYIQAVNLLLNLWLVSIVSYCKVSSRRRNKVRI